MKNSVTAAQAYPKIKYYCSYRERCHYEVKEKLFGMGLSKTEVEQLVSQLIEEDFLNEERFCVQFAGSHFRLRKWGRVKIMYALRQKRVSEVNIKRALREIEAVDYSGVLQKIAQSKWDSLKKEQNLTRQAKTTAYLLQKGYEGQMVQLVIAGIRAAQKKDS